MKYFKYIIFWCLFLVVSSSWAVLFTGLSIKVDTFLDSTEAKSTVFIELCKVNADTLGNCKGNIEVIDCRRESSESKNLFQWNCLTKENFPFRLGLKIGKDTYYSSDLWTVAENTTTDRYALHLTGHQLSTLKIPYELTLQVGLQEMLENVFHPSVVQKIREKDQNKKNQSWEYIDQPETKLILSACEFEDCSKGKREEVSCKFATLGIRGLSYSCPMPSFTRYMSFVLYGRDKIRKSQRVPFKDSKSSNRISVKSNSLEL